MGHRVSKTIREEIIRKVQAGERVAELAEQYAVSTKTIACRWCSQHRRPCPLYRKTPAISEACIANLTPQINAAQLDAFVQQVQALSTQANPQTPPGCAADLIAVAQALQARQ